MCVNTVADCTKEYVNVCALRVVLSGDARSVAYVVDDVDSLFRHDEWPSQCR